MKTNLLSLICVFVFFACSSPDNNELIVLVDVGDLDRSDIAKEISIIEEFSPGVLAVDAMFTDRLENSSSAHLSSAIGKCDKIVLAGRIDSLGSIPFMYTSEPEFTPPHAKIGFINAILDNDEFHTQSKFMIRNNPQPDEEVKLHFSVQVALMFDSAKATRFIEEHSKITQIDFDKERRFLKISASDILNRKFEQKDVRGKIVLLGYLGPTGEDKFFTPLNRDRSPGEPDMYGVEILANIVAQILE